MNVPLYKQIYDCVLDQINQGQIKMGEKIPSEKDLANQFNVSRITSKKALDLLAQENIIERIQGKGSFVSKSNDVHDGLNHHNSDSVIEREEKEKILQIGMVISDFSDNNGTELVKAVERHAANFQAHLLIKITNEKIEEEEKAIEELLQVGVDGIIILPIHGEHYNPKILELVLKKYPIVLVDRYLRGIPASSVSTDNTKAAKEATEYLMSRGHRNIAYITPPYEGTTVLEDRIKGFQLAHSEQHRQLNPEYLITNIACDLAYQEVRGNDFYTEVDQIKQFMNQNSEITAFVASRYAFAEILVNVIQNMKKSVPEDYSIVCFDSPRTLIGPPSFTHISQREKEMGAKTVKVLMDQIRGRNEIISAVVDYDLIEGQSTTYNKKR